MCLPLLIGWSNMPLAGSSIIYSTRQSSYSSSASSEPFLFIATPLHPSPPPLLHQPITPLHPPSPLPLHFLSSPSSSSSSYSSSASSFSSSSALRFFPRLFSFNLCILRVFFFLLLCILCV